MTIEELYDRIASRKKEMPDDSYVASLFRDGIDRITQKVGEEAIEVVIAAKNVDEQRLVEELSDLIFHLQVLMIERNIAIADIQIELGKRSDE